MLSPHTNTLFPFCALLCCFALCAATRTLTGSPAKEEYGIVESGKVIKDTPRRRLMDENIQIYIEFPGVTKEVAVTAIEDCKEHSTVGLCMDPKEKPDEIVKFFEEKGKRVAVLVLKALFSAGVPYKVEKNGIAFGAISEETKSKLPAGLPLKEFARPAAKATTVGSSKED